MNELKQPDPELTLRSVRTQTVAFLKGGIFVVTKTDNKRDNKSISSEDISSGSKQCILSVCKQNKNYIPSLCKEELYKKVTTKTFLFSDLKQVPLRCDCKLNSFVAFMAKSSSLKVVGSCKDTKERLVDLKGTNLCGNYSRTNLYFYIVHISLLYSCSLCRSSKGHLLFAHCTRTP